MTPEERKEMEDQYKSGNQREALLIIGFGIVMLGLATFLNNHEVPMLRQGRLMLAFAVGAAALVYGAHKWLNAGWKD